MDNRSPSPDDALSQLPERRTVEQVSMSALAAGLTNSIGPIQLLHFSPQLHTEDLRLMEVHGPVLSALRSGERLIIRGNPSDDAVLCTKDKTFEVRVADTSNALLVAPSLQLSQNKDASSSEIAQSSLQPCEVIACLGSYLEVRQCRPRIERLKVLLSECPYRGAEFEEEEEEEVEGADAELGSQGWEMVDSAATMDIGEDAVRQRRKKKQQAPRKYTFEDLLNLVQASEEELYDALNMIQACPILGYWRCLDLDYRDRVFQHVLTLLVEKDWSYRRVPLEASSLLLQELEPRFAIEHCISCYGNRIGEGSEVTEGEIYYELSEEKVCQFYAELLLRPAGKFSYQEFMESWQQSVPEGMRVSTDQLKGLALMDSSTLPPSIWHFPADDLPHDPLARFHHLFQVKQKWTFAEIEPYIKDLVTPSQPLNAMLMKFARVSTDGKGHKLYSSKNRT